MKELAQMIMVVASVLGLTTAVHGDALSIYQIQYTTDANGLSPQHGNIVDCLGGIVVHKSSGSRTKLTLHDPANGNGWGGIMAKDPYGVGAFADVNGGDWISFTNVEVEDFKGTTFLQYKAQNGADFTIVSTNHPLPRPLVVGLQEIAAPLEGPDRCVVVDHNAEKYEGILVTVVNVTVADTGHGKAFDNYVLQSSVEANLACWASDYMNADIAGIYHPFVRIGQRFCGVTGILEQYTGEKDGIYYDYYQLLTTSTDDFIIDQIADFDYDCKVDFLDFSVLTGHWLEAGCSEPDWCDGADLTKDDSSGTVDIADLAEFVRHWLKGG